MFELFHDHQLVYLFGSVLALLIVFSIAAGWLKSIGRTEAARLTVTNLNSRIRAWWKMCVVFVLTLLLGRVGTLVLFGIISFMAMREYMTLVPTHRSDHRTLFWSFFVIMPLQYYLLGMQRYGTFAIMIPVFASAFIPTSIAIEGDTSHFLERVAKIQFGLMVCVYCLSHAPAMLAMSIPGFAGHDARLLLYFGVVDQVSDLLQYIWGKLAGKHKIAWRVSPNKTWEGFLGGALSAAALGAALWWVTPFTPLQSAGMAFMICVLGFAGGLVMSAIKRDIGIKDFGMVVEAHGGILDRIDSLCFAAPIFFHLVRFYFVR